MTVYLTHSLEIKSKHGHGHSLFNRVEDAYINAMSRVKINQRSNHPLSKLFSESTTDT